MICIPITPTNTQLVGPKERQRRRNGLDSLLNFVYGWIKPVRGRCGVNARPKCRDLLLDKCKNMDYYMPEKHFFWLNYLVTY